MNIDARFAIITIFVYIGLLFLAAQWWEAKIKKKQFTWLQPFIYALSFACYQTAWSLLGNSGDVTRTGYQFIAIELGPVISAFLWWVILRKMVVLKNIFRITNLADFFSTRYGKNTTVGLLVSVSSALVGIPYIGLQLRSIVDSFSILTDTQQTYASPLESPFLYAFFASLVGAAAIIFGLRKIDPSERHPGLTAVLALEAVFKLAAITVVGVFVTYFLFDGFTDILTHASDSKSLTAFTTPHLEGDFYINWLSSLLMSMFGILFLPRMFHVAVVENSNEKHILTAAWLFPLFTLLLTLFVIPIAIGSVLKSVPVALADMFLIQTPLSQGHPLLALFAFLGGFSASTSMAIVALTTTSIMLSNYALIPALDLIAERWRRFGRTSPLSFLQRHLLVNRWLACVLILLGSLVFLIFVDPKLSLSDIGEMALAATAQFAPLAFGALFWRRANKTGAIVGLSLGLTLWFYTLILPSFIAHGIPSDFTSQGPFGLHFLRPTALLGLSSLPLVAHSLFWSLAANASSFVLVSLFTKQNAFEIEIAGLFAEPNAPLLSPRNMKPRSLQILFAQRLTKIRTILLRYLDSTAAEELVKTSVDQLGIQGTIHITLPTLAALQRELEKRLGGIIGSAWAHRAVAAMEILNREEVEELTHIYAERLATLHLSPTEIQEKLDYHNEREQMLLRHASELQMKIDDRNREITRRQGAEKELLHAIKEAESANRAKTEFLAVISHELRTPLNSILGGTDLLSERDLPNESQEEIALIKRNAHLLRSIIEDILSYAQISAGKLVINNERFRLREVIKDVFSTMASLAEAKNLKMLTEVDPQLADEWIGDSLRLKQILINLIGNAIKFTDHGSVTVRVSQDPSPANSPYEALLMLRFEVNDTGIGIPTEAKEKLFIPFSQLDSTLTRKIGGTGLGLAICRRLTELMHGQIGVNSTLGSGTTFWFNLPLQSVTAQVIQSRPVAKPPSHAGYNGHVLIADDARDNQILMQRMLTHLGLSCEIVSNGAEAVTKASDQKFDLILMDIMMPVLDGIEAIKLIRSPGHKSSQVPIVAMSARVMEEEMAAYKAAGANDVLKKPLTIGSLRDVLDRLLPAAPVLASPGPSL